MLLHPPEADAEGTRGTSPDMAGATEVEVARETLSSLVLHVRAQGTSEGKRLVSVYMTSPWQRTGAS